MRVFVGTYTDSGVSSGIYSVDLDTCDGTLHNLSLAAPAINPSWLVAHPQNQVLYSVSEQNSDSASVRAWYIAVDGSLRPAGEVATGGADPCHISVDPGGAFIVASNYSGGSIASIALGNSGEPVDNIGVWRHTGHSLDPVRQTAPHVHSTLLAGDGLYVADLGLDVIRHYRLTPEGRLTDSEVPDLVLEPGSGPRLMAGDGRHELFVLTELDNRLIANRIGTDGWPYRVVESQLRTGSAGSSYAAHLASSRDGRYLYASNRGDDSIVVLDRQNLKVVCDVSSGGGHPRHFAFAGADDQWLICANRDSNNIVVFERNTATGELNRTGVTLEVPVPVCVLPM